MKYIILILTVAYVLGCAKQEKSSNQNIDSVKTSTGSTEDVKQTSKTTSQPVKTYKKGEPIELYDLIYMLLPDESETSDKFDWSKVDEISAIKWGKKECWEERCSKNTKDVSITINDKKYWSRDNGGWNIDIDGNEAGWSAFDISYVYNSADVFDLECDIEIKKLLNNQAFTSKIIEKGDNGYNCILHEVSFPGKKMFWMKVWEDHGIGRGGGIHSFIIDCFLNKNEIEKF